MEIEQNPFRVPIGEAKKLELQKETLPAVGVKNKVSWINDKLDILPVLLLF